MEKLDDGFFIQQQINKDVAQIIEEHNIRINDLENLNKEFDAVDIIGLSIILDIILDIVFFIVIYFIFIK